MWRTFQPAGQPEFVESASVAVSDTDNSPSIVEDSEVSIPELPAVPDYTRDILPLIENKCLDCHRKGGAATTVEIDRDPRSWKMASGLAAIDLDNCSTSPLLTFFSSNIEGQAIDFPCRITSDDISLLTQWIKLGAYVPSQQPEYVGDWGEAEQTHWAYQPFSDLVPPEVQDRSLVRNPIDRFILHRLEEEGLGFASRATGETLVRRISISLTGLTPSVEMLDEFATSSDEGLDRLIDQRLDEPSFGEHWATYWLDLVRYADTNGYEHDSLKPLGWKYRDFVIRSFNEDLRFDQFVMKQIAGDLFQNPKADDFVASGFLRLGAWDSEPDDVLRDRFDQLDEVVSTTSQVFLGLTIGCARCHEHPLDPVTETDYSRLVATFSHLSRPLNGKLEEPAKSLTLAQKAELAQLQVKIRQLRKKALQTKDDAIADQLRREATDLASSFPFEMAYRFLDHNGDPSATRRLRRGDPHHPLELVAAGVPSILATSKAERDFDQAIPSRLAFARWVLEDQAELSARLIVNRVWAWHFGTGIVETLNNFGPSGAIPSHPELLDWLAHWFIHDAKWSLKKLHRLILTSRTWRSRSTIEKTQLATLFGEFPQQRLRAEVIYDSLLQIAEIGSKRLYGPPSYPRLTEEVLSTVPEKGAWDSPDDELRRAVYLIVQRNLPVPDLQLLDQPSRTSSQPDREASANVSQALLLWNGDLVNRCARHLAMRVEKRFPQQPSEQLKYAWRIATGRDPDASELELLVQFVETAAVNEPLAASQVKEPTPLQQACTVILNCDEFMYLK